MTTGTGGHRGRSWRRAHGGHGHAPLAGRAHTVTGPTADGAGPCARARRRGKLVAPSRPEVPDARPRARPRHRASGPARAAPTATPTCAPTPRSATPAPSRWSPSTGASTGGRSPTSTPAPPSRRSSTPGAAAGSSWPRSSPPRRPGATCPARTSWRPRTSPRRARSASSTRSTPAAPAACRGRSWPAGSRGSRAGCRCGSRSRRGPASTRRRPGRTTPCTAPCCASTTSRWPCACSARSRPRSPTRPCTGRSAPRPGRATSSA